MKKKILFTILGLILAGLIYCGGAYLGAPYLSPKISPLAESQSDFYSYFFPPVGFSFADGFAVIKDIDTNNSTITLFSQIDESKILKVNFNENSQFYQFLGWENGIVKADQIELKDLKINDKVYFTGSWDKNGVFTLYWLNVAAKE